MDQKKLILFAHEVHYQCQLIVRAGHYLDAASALADKNIQTSEVFYHLPVLLAGAAGVSKTLWAQADSKARTERQALRDHFKQADDSPFHPNGAIGRSMRNNFEHFDDRLDSWWKTGNHDRYYEQMILHGDLHFLGLIDPDPPREYGPPFYSPSYFSNIPDEHLNLFRSFGVDNKRIMFWGEILKMDFVVSEAKLLLRIALPVV